VNHSPHAPLPLPLTMMVSVVPTTSTPPAYLLHPWCAGWWVLYLPFPRSMLLFSSWWLQAGGGFVVLNASSLEVLFQEPKSHGSVTEIKYSVSGDVLAVACTDHKIHVFDGRDYTPRVVLTGVRATPCVSCRTFLPLPLTHTPERLIASFLLYALILEYLWIHR
jgi:hypothetical protein